MSNESYIENYVKQWLNYRMYPDMQTGIQKVSAMLNTDLLRRMYQECPSIKDMTHTPLTDIYVAGKYFDDATKTLGLPTDEEMWAVFETEAQSGNVQSLIYEYYNKASYLYADFGIDVLRTAYAVHQKIYKPDVILDDTPLPEDADIATMAATVLACTSDIHDVHKFKAATWVRETVLVDAELHLERAYRNIYINNTKDIDFIYLVNYIKAKHLCNLSMFFSIDELNTIFEVLFPTYTVDVPCNFYTRNDVSHDIFKAFDRYSTEGKKPIEMKSWYLETYKKHLDFKKKYLEFVYKKFNTADKLDIHELASRNNIRTFEIEIDNAFYYFNYAGAANQYVEEGTWYHKILNYSLYQCEQLCKQQLQKSGLIDASVSIYDYAILYAQCSPDVPAFTYMWQKALFVLGSYKDSFNIISEDL